MAVEHITYQGKRLPVKLGYYALKMLQKEQGADMQALQGNFELYEPLLFYSLKQGHKVEGEKLAFKMTDMVDILDDCFFEFIALIPKFFPQDLAEKMMEGVGTKETPTMTRSAG